MSKGLRLQKLLSLPWAHIFGVCLVAWLFVVLASSYSKSPVVDEVPHIGAGLSYWKFHDFRMNPEHPPLVKALAALPVMLLDRVPVIFQTEEFHVSSWYKSMQDHYGYFLLFRNKVNPRTVVFHARLVPVAIAALGALLAFWWGRRISRTLAGGTAAGLLLMLYPEYAGHGRFVTLDVPTLVACAGLSAAGYTWWRRPGLMQTIIFVSAAAIGSLVKLPVTIFCVFLLGVLLVMTLAARGRIAVWRYLTLIASTVVAGYFAAWAAAGFRFQLTNPELLLLERSVYAPLDGYFGEGLLGSLLSFAWRYRLLPEASLATLKHVQSFGGRNYYFMGEWARQGWYSYFFVTFLLKTSLVMTGVYAAALVTWAYQLWRMGGARRSIELSRLAILLVPFVMLFVVFVLGRTSLGHRYILFMYFPLSVLAGAAMARWWMKSRGGMMLSTLVILYGVVTFARQYPHYETYFNEIIRTPYRALPYVADSNVDWGQDFPLMGDELRDRGIRQFNMAAFGSARPSAYGVNAYRWILPNYPFAIFHDQEAVMPDPQLPTAMSMHAFLAAKTMYPKLYSGEPAWTENSVVLFAAQE